MLSKCKGEETPRFNNVVYSVSCSDLSMDIKGWIDQSSLEGEINSIILKKRGSSLLHSIPIEWSDDGHWEAHISLKKYTIYKGTWDFYFQCEETTIRMKVEHPIPDEAQMIYKLESESLLLNVYKTIKDSLSIKSGVATIQMENVITTKYNGDNWKINIWGLINDTLMSGFEDGSKSYMIVKQRNSDAETEFSAEIRPQLDKYEMSIDFDYKELICLDDIIKQTWDCYLSLMINGEKHLVRVTWEEANSLREHSRIQFETPYIYEIYFYMTVNNNMSIRLTGLPIVRNIEHIFFEDYHLVLKGYAYLDSLSEDVYGGSLIIKRRGSQDELVYKLTDENISKKGDFNIKVSLTEMGEFEVKEKEIFDLYVRFDYKNQIYERKLGCEEYTYFKDHFLDHTTLRLGQVTKYYILFTPRGNLKIETFMLSKLAYYYLNYGKELDRKLHRNKEIWLIGERHNTAQDTGYHFFKYCRENHPELNVYYIIDRDSKDVENIKELGNVIYSGSLKHARLSAMANTFIGSHDLDYFLALKGSDLENYRSGKRIFLQHGVLGRKNVEYHKNYYIYPYHLFCVSSQSEKKLVQKKMNYQPEEVKVTGLSRFDYLLSENDTENTILLIPTWREWLTDENKLKQSTYFKKYKSLLNNQELHKLLKQYNMTLNFYPHYRMQPFVEEFKELAKENIQVIELGDKNVQDLLIESKLMITDYSSVSFDFNYMSKPVIFYHFDSATFFKNGILRPIKDTFLGDVCKTEHETISSLEDYLKSDFEEKGSVTEKKKKIFDTIDQKNNERIFREIKKI